MATTRVTIRTEDAALAYLASINVALPGSTVERDGVTYVVEPCPCGRCGGSGNGGWYPDGGICYECRGANTMNRTRSTRLIVWARNERKRDLARSKKIAKVEAHAEALLDGQRRWCAENTSYGAVTFAERDDLRDAEREAARAAAAETATHLDAPVKARIELDLTLSASFSFEGYYGTTMVYKWTAPCGATLVWKTSATSTSHWVKDSDGFERPPNKGETVHAKLTVKEHGEYRELAPRAFYDRLGDR